ncbi:hypothetical protein, partial [Escherichia coli]|uniref:hypothetical protein n=1 Tax=Escherichia coli TaxID=562 RepID=UPI001BC8A7BB
ADRNRSHWSTSKTPSYTKSVSWQHHPTAKSFFSRELKVHGVSDVLQLHIAFSVSLFISCLL